VIGNKVDVQGNDYRVKRPYYIQINVLGMLHLRGKQPSTPQSDGGAVKLIKTLGSRNGLTKPPHPIIVHIIKLIIFLFFHINSSASVAMDSTDAVLRDLRGLPNATARQLRDFLQKVKNWLFSF
jgi:hypothetical protein